ncbi:MAG: metal-sensitive transcriptional regulator [Propionibacteriaceae bacterium]|nr:metal-sensitive transcriptional regulator [Propionibacteriaceae bacterium]
MTPFVPAPTRTGTHPQPLVPSAPDAEEQKRQILNRLRRAYGQLGASIAAVEADADCRAVIPQLAAVSSAVDRAGFAMVTLAMRHCLTTSGTIAGSEDPSLAEVEKLFMMLR